MQQCLRQRHFLSWCKQWVLWKQMDLLPPATKLGQGYIFTGVCDSVHGGGGGWGWYPSMHCRWYPSMPCSRGCAIPACLAGGVPAPGGCLVQGGCSGGGAWSGGCLLPGGLLLVETPPDGHCCGWYASYWNAFLFTWTLTLATYTAT